MVAHVSEGTNQEDYCTRWDKEKNCYKVSARKQQFVSKLKNFLFSIPSFKEQQRFFIYIKI